MDLEGTGTKSNPITGSDLGLAEMVMLSEILSSVNYSSDSGESDTKGAQS